MLRALCRGWRGAGISASAQAMSGVEGGVAPVLEGTLSGVEGWRGRGALVLGAPLLGGRGGVRWGDPEALLPQEALWPGVRTEPAPSAAPARQALRWGPGDGPGPTQPAGLGADNPLLAPPSAQLASQDCAAAALRAPVAASWCRLPR